MLLFSYAENEYPILAYALYNPSLFNTFAAPYSSNNVSLGGERKTIQL